MHIPEQFLGENDQFRIILPISNHLPSLMQILDHVTIQRKTERLSIEILEHHQDEAELYLLGINNNGMAFAQKLLEQLQKRTDQPIHLHPLQLSPAHPHEHPIQVDLPLAQLQDKVIIIVDDVANTGRTLFYAMQPLLTILTKTIEVAVLVDRKHKSFPVWVKYVGLSLSTTLQDHIQVDLSAHHHSVLLQ